ncbi:MAG: nuclear transport factor 2 family protein [Alphaproteobacteria bacterium]|nr:nuclear transport factor 2 family protein [Alphaproteobacteria bacterium]
MSTLARSASEVVHAFMGEMECLDYEAAMTHVAPDCEYTNPPPIGTVHGPEGVRAVLEPFFAPTLENEFRILREATDGARVFVERLDRHRLKDRWVELPVTGVYEVVGHKIVYWRDYFDAQTILSQWPSS